MILHLELPGTDPHIRSSNTNSLTAPHAKRGRQCLSWHSPIHAALTHVSLLSLPTDPGRAQRHGGRVPMVRRDPVGTGPLQAHQQLCAKHPGGGGIRRFHGEMALSPLLLTQICETEPPALLQAGSAAHIRFTAAHS